MAAKSKMLWTLWQKYSSNDLNQIIDMKYKILSEAVCVLVETDAARFSRLGDSDEAIYTHLVGLMGVYRRVIELAKACTFESPTVRSLILGICEVLTSRLREFEEEETPEGSPNPIALEKNAIIDEEIVKVAELIDAQRISFTDGLRKDEPQIWDESFEIILRDNIRELYLFYSNGLVLCETKIDDLHSRKAARFYSELIEREWEELGNIIKVQVLALEEAVKNTEDVTIPGILDALREAYQQIGPFIEHMQNLSKKPMPCRSFDEFEGELLAALENENQPQQKIFIAALDAETMVLLDKIDMEFKKSAYKFQLFISAEILLAEEVTRVFEGTLSEIAEAGKDIERDILSGIRETIEIKIDGLKESIQDFIIQSSANVKKFSSEKKSEKSTGERSEILEAVRSAWLESPPTEDEIPAFFENCGEIFLPYRERAEKQVASFMGILEKMSFRFKKEVLLYEVCTFEEILTHSVSRLRDSQDADVLSAASLLDDAFGELEKILKKNNIAIIRPNVKEPFNAKEHEVLVAEKHDDFEKGEIIKIMTAGYRFKEQVIIRANVIAAK